MMLDLSVVVPTHNRKGYLPDLLRSLVEQDYPSDRWELVIVDDGSSDGTQESIESGVHPLPRNTRVLSQVQSGVAAARNLGANNALGRGVLFLDDDMVAAPRLVSCHAQVHAEAQWAVVIGHITTPTAGREPWVAWEDAQMERHYQALKSGSRVPGPRDFYTGNCSVSADLFRSVGGFDTSLKRTEDVELGYRLQAVHAKFHYDPHAESLHLGKHDYDKWLSNAHIYGEADVLLAWQRGNTGLRQDIFSWYLKRNPIHRALVLTCTRLPYLEKPLTAVLHLLGRTSYSLGMSRVSSGSYSAIYNLAYWLAIIEAVGAREFWASARKLRAESVVIGQELADSSGGSLAPNLASEGLPE